MNIFISAVKKIGIGNAWLFMSAFLLQMLAICLVDRQAWKRSHVPSGASRNRIERHAGFIGNIVWMVAMLYSIFLPFQLATAWFYIGLSVFLFGLILLTIATFNFIATSEQEIITAGVYRISRHPMYVASFFICLGSGIAAASWIFIFLGIIMAWCFYFEARVEEKYCLNKYGDAYKKYLKKTPRVIGMKRK